MVNNSLAHGHVYIKVVKRGDVVSVIQPRQWYPDFCRLISKEMCIAKGV